MPPIRPAPWDVVRGYCHQVSPQKVKRVVCVRLEEEHFLGFFFNTRLNQWVLKNPNVLPYHLPFQAAGRDYLDTDCFLDTSEVFVLQYFQRWERLGELSLQDATRVRTAISTSFLLPPKTIRHLLT